MKTDMPIAKSESLSPLSVPEITQKERTDALLASTPTLGESIESRVLPFSLDPSKGTLTPAIAETLAALEKKAAHIAIKSLISLAKANDIDHLGGGLELIPALLMTLGSIDYDKRHFAIEHGHASIGYYAPLAALGFLPEDRVIENFRRSLDIAGHVSWVPGGTPIGTGRLGVAVPVATGLALGLKARKGSDGLVICHCGDAGWISGQALNGFNAASLHEAPITFVMHRNGIQLSGTTRKIMDRDPRQIIAAFGIEILEVASLHDRQALFNAYAAAFRLAASGHPSLIYPTGFRSSPTKRVTLSSFGEMYGITTEVAQFADKQKVPLNTEVWIPGSLMSFRDVHAMLECLFLVNDLPGGEGHHDGGMKGRDGQSVLENPMLKLTDREAAALQALQSMPRRTVVTRARPPKGTPNLPLTDADVKDIQLPAAGKPVTPRAGSEAAYAAVAKKYPDRCFFVSCDLNPSTKLGKAASLVPPGHSFELSIEELAASLVNDGLSFMQDGPQLNAFATFAAFIEGIAREGFEMWRYQRNLNGRNEGLNVVMHLSHVGACTGRDHFSGWSLDWVNLALGYLPFLRRFYAPSDARNAFLAVKDAAGSTGGHVVAIPRDILPILTKQGTSDPIWNATDTWTASTVLRQYPDSRVAILALGAPTYLAVEASDQLASQGASADVYVVNGFPLPEMFFVNLASRYQRVITIEDGLIGTVESGLRGFAGLAASELYRAGLTVEPLGITDPGVAPSEHFMAVWEHYGITKAAIVKSILAGKR
jgi:transketolase N-terminal domain/subunit/transketolase C-terminal domain/subunit